MYKIAICEDEEYYAKKIRQMLESLLLERGKEGEIDVFESGEDLCRNLKRIKTYDMIFLDVEMREMNGIEVAEVIRSVNRDIVLAFISAYAEYAHRGYRLETLRYILKSQLDEELPECLDTMLEKLEKKEQTIRLKCSCGLKEIKIESIVYIRSFNRKILCYLYEDRLKQLEAYGKMQDMVKRLESRGFLRIHRSYLVNSKYIEDLKRGVVRFTREVGYGEGDLDGLPIPATKYNEIREQYFKIRGDLK